MGRPRGRMLRRINSFTGAAETLARQRPEFQLDHKLREAARAQTWEEGRRSGGDCDGDSGRGEV